MSRKKLGSSSSSEDDFEEKGIKPLTHPSYSEHLLYFIKANATRSKSNEQKTSLRPVRATNIFDQSTPSAIASSQSHPTNLYRSDTKLSPAWFQHSHEQLLSLHTKNSPKPQQPITPSQCGTFPRRKDNQFSTPHQSNIKYGSGQIGDRQSSHSRSTKSRCMYN